MKYRKKPIVIEAFQYDGDFQNREGIFYIPTWGIKAYREGTLFFDGDTLKIKILEGTMTVTEGDYIIKSVNGDIYPCNPETFKKIYEEIK